VKLKRGHLELGGAVASIHELPGRLVLENPKVLVGIKKGRSLLRRDTDPREPQA
jgi:hypothetical protein